jgi:hypothetical protein
VNDGAKSAQGSAFLVGLYLLATAFSASDEDLLLGKTLAISQIGASLPVSFSFAIAPLVFVFLHIYTLVRYDMLAANIRQFREELNDTVSLESDRKRCRQLLTNNEFVSIMAIPHDSASYFRFWLWLFFGIVAAFPVAALLVVQVNALRYQNDQIVNIQRVTLALDLAALIWFFRRNTLDGSAWPERRLPRVRRWAGLLLAPILIGAVNGFYLGTVPPEADENLVRYPPLRLLRFLPEIKIENWWLAKHFLHQPLDEVLCPWLTWGCRFLSVPHRLLVDKARDETAVITLHGDRDVESAKEKTALGAIDGVFLPARSLRFVVLFESRLYGAELSGADLRSAHLGSTDLPAPTWARPT